MLFSIFNDCKGIQNPIPSTPLPTFEDRDASFDRGSNETLVDQIRETPLSFQSSESEIGEIIDLRDCT